MLLAYDYKSIELAVGASGSQTFGIYVGYQEIRGIIGPAKVGRTVNVQALQRGRSQGGANWWFYAWWPVCSRDETYAAEAKVKAALKEYRYTGAQGQRELYDLPLPDLVDKINAVLGKYTILTNERIIS